MARKRNAACALILVALLAAIGPSAGGVTRVRHTLLARHETVERVRALRRQENRLEAGLRRRVSAMERATTSRFAVGLHGQDERRRATIIATDHLLVIARARLRSLDPWARRRLRALRSRYANLQAWLDRQGILRVCPVPSFESISDDFGAIVRLPHVPIHRHEGNDVAAPAGSPILAPFDGYASTSHGELGGLEVRVFGADGYVYNAHLSAVGQLGWVRTGDVVGYIGATGDATGPHDHIEWHPNDGAAVDPHALLVAACVDTATGS
jgi:murein DD-endopeptidase MepM/ murein hydrolase activator NlpD